MNKKPKFNNIRDAMRCACQLEKRVYKDYRLKGDEKIWFYYVDD